MIKQKTDILTTCGDVVIRIADFIEEGLDSHSFVGIGMKDKYGKLMRHIYCDRAEIEERRYNDLVYESKSETYTYSEFVDNNPEYENKDPYITLKARLCYLKDKDLIPNTI